MVGKKFSWLQEVQQKVNVQEIKDLSRSLYSPSNLKNKSLKLFYGNDQTNNPLRFIQNLCEFKSSTFDFFFQCPTTKSLLPNLNEVKTPFILKFHLNCNSICFVALLKQKVN